MPSSITTKTPPTFPNPNSFTDPEDLIVQLPPPFFSFHQRSLNVWRCPCSWSFNMPPDNQALRALESENNNCDICMNIPYI
ncbi:hypothetical protein NPIL_20551 [Nephila pilipes]|uniref:Uncharacterized protein n=1 Tax=Nephila pilipes TaxID=299642 RepID=A0A8X6UER1_NEPPI|nr:hypothetical protein NPIL_20551 [Nephila pilipes]